MSHSYDQGPNRSHDLKRLSIIVLIAALAAFLLFMIGATAERMNLQRGMHASSSTRRVYSLSFLASLILNVTKVEIALSEFLSAGRAGRPIPPGAIVG